MSQFTNPDPATVRPGERIVTACGSTTVFTPGTVSATYQGKPVYFCMFACKKDFEREPAASCLALTLSAYDD